ncbi:MAG: glycosyltransferase family 2 protein [Patescibacteria group bacterium]
MTVAIQLVTWNGAKYLSPLLASLRDQTYKDWQIFIWDNGSTDNTVAELGGALTGGWCRYEITKSDKNIGFASAHNRLFAQCSALHIPCYVFLLNQDTVLEPDYIEKLVDFLGQHSEVGSVTGRIMKLNDRQKIDSMGLKILITGQVVEITTVPSCHSERSGAKSKNLSKDPSTPPLAGGVAQDDNYPFEVFGVSGALPVYRITAIKQLGLFDEDFFSYKEDVDLAYRLRRAGFKAYCVPRAVAYHDRSAGTAGGLVRTAQEYYNRSELINFYSYRNHIFVLIKNLDRRDFWRLPFIFIYELGKFFYLLILEPKVLSKAWADIWRLAPKMIKKRHI